MAILGMQNICQISSTNPTTPTGQGRTLLLPQLITPNTIDITLLMTIFSKPPRITKMFPSSAIPKSIL